MSDRSDKLYLEDINDSSEAIISYVKSLSYEQFGKDRKTVSATIREFEIIGEAVGKLSEEIKSIYAEIEWQDIKDLRNILVHEYFGIDPEILWKVIQNDSYKRINYGIFKSLNNTAKSRKQTFHESQCIDPVRQRLIVNPENANIPVSLVKRIE